MPAHDIPVWWIGLSSALLLVGIVFEVLIFAVLIRMAANEWVQLIFLGALAAGVSLFLLFPAFRSERDHVSTTPRLGDES